MNQWPRFLTFVCYSYGEFYLLLNFIYLTITLQGCYHRSFLDSHNTIDLCLLEISSVISMMGLEPKKEAKGLASTNKILMKDVLYLTNNVQTGKLFYYLFIRCNFVLFLMGL